MDYKLEVRGTIYIHYPTKAEAASHPGNPNGPKLGIAVVVANLLGELLIPLTASST
jgi:hypothetical protein